MFGKTAENILNLVDIGLCTDGKQVCKLTAKPEIKARLVYAKSPAGTHVFNMFNKHPYVE